MINGPKEVLQIRVHDPLVSSLDLPPDFAQRILRRPSWPISEVGIIEYRFEDRFHPVEQRLLTYPIVDRRNAQHARLSRFACLGNRHPPDWFGAIGIFLQFSMQPIQILL